MKKFMTCFDELKVFDNYAQELDIVVDAVSLNATTKNIFFEQQFLDINKNVIVGQKYTRPIRPLGGRGGEPRGNYLLGIHRFCITPPVPAITLNNQMAYVRYRIVNNDNINNVIAEKFAALCFAQQNKNDMPIRWLNNLGGFDFWLFRKPVFFDTKTEEGIGINYYAMRNKRVFDKKTIISFKVSEKVEKKYLSGLESLAYARQAYIEDKFAEYAHYRTIKQYTLIEILPKANTLRINESHDGYYDFNLEFDLIRLNI